MRAKALRRVPLQISMLFIILFLLISAGSVTVQAAPRASISVNSMDDPGDGTCNLSECTLREAIDLANSGPGLDTIDFNGLSGGAPYIIQPGSALPDITEAVILDGTTHPDYAGAPVIWIEGSNVGPTDDGLVITSGGSTVRGLIIGGFGNSGLVLRTGGGNTVEDNYIGIDDTGSFINPNGFEGIEVDGSASNLIQDNVISGNGADGIGFWGSGASNNQVYGNLIGLDPTGVTDMGNTAAGVYILAGSNNVIGGVVPGQSNVIAGNGKGVEISGVGNSVKANLVGYAADGVTPMVNDGEAFVLSVAGSSLTVAGNQTRVKNTQPAFRLNSGTLTAYANNLSGFGSGVINTGGTFKGAHNWWGSAFTAPLGLSAADWAARLGAPMAAWAEGNGSATLGSAMLSGGTGTAVIVSHGRGLANAPFGNGVAPYVDQMCSEFYDFFTVNGSGTWQADVPVDNTVDCNANTLTPMKLAWIPAGTDYTAECTPASNTNCWDGIPVVRVSAPGGQILRVNGLTVAELGGTQIVAGDSGGNDPTVVSLAGFAARPADQSFGWAAGIAVLALAAVALFAVRRLLRD